MNAMTAPSDILARAVPKWQARDDVYQVGQLLGMLIKGDAQERIRTARRSPAAVQRSLEGDRPPLHRRAAEALRERRRDDRRAAQPAAGAEGRRPADAQRRAPRLHRHPEQAPPRSDCAPRDGPGAIVHGRPSAPTTVVVRGRPNAQQAAGREAGLKLMEIKRLREKGHRITLLNEAQFWRLASKR